MITKKQIQWIRSLRLKKERDVHHCYVVEGEKIVLEAIKNIPESVKMVLTVSDFNFNNTIDETFVVSEKQMSQASNQKTPSGFLAVIDFPNWPEINFTENALVLDDIRDPGNLGTIIRIADWFGIKQVIASKNTVDVYNYKVVQSSMGSVFRIPVHYIDIKDFLKNEWKDDVLGLVLDGEPLNNLEKSNNAAIVIGNESNGISKEIDKLLTKRIKIEGLGEAESLNAAIATGIMAYQLMIK